MIDTERLILRGWRDSDIDPFHAMGNDPEVMEFLGPFHSRADAEAAAARQNEILAAFDHCFWAAERRADGAFLGFCGVQPGPADTPIHGEIEIGWRLARACWGQGYAREAAQASLDWVWANLDVDSVAAMTVTRNTRSWGLMERLGMARAHGDDFDHPNVPIGNPIRRHIVYRIARSNMVNGR
ncbi:MAG: GNAT family N-acetyltransferase [Pseudomonadota bacterium]